MSVRAYRVIEIKPETPSFNLWHDRELMRFLDAETNFSNCLNPDGTGVVSIPAKTLERAVRISTKLKLDKETVRQLRLDIKQATSKGDDTITYYCC